MAEKTLYQTSDGMVFNNERDAGQPQERLNRLGGYVKGFSDTSIKEIKTVNKDDTESISALNKK